MIMATRRCRCAAPLASANGRGNKSRPRFQYWMVSMGENGLGGHNYRVGGRTEGLKKFMAYSDSG